MAILTINAGSSSVKFTLFPQDGDLPRASGIVERIGLEGTRLKYRRRGGETLESPVAVADADRAVEVILSALVHPQHGVIPGIGEIEAVGHRVVHGGERLTRPVVLDAEVKAYLESIVPLAPLHNPHHLRGIAACERHIPHAVQVAVFDTAFHATLPRHAFLYGIPLSFYAEDGVRRYGFHGISHKYVAAEAARFLNRAPAGLKLVTCHLGNGCSLTAVRDGQSVDTSMGFTPLEGVLMGTRSGDIDPAAVLYLMERRGFSPAAMNDLLNRRSGLLAVAGVGSNDVRDVLSAARDGNDRAELALEMFCYRIRKTIGAYAAVLGGLDAVVFTAGIGENSPEIRRRIAAGLEFLGLALDPARNEAEDSGPRAVHAAESRVAALVIPTNEELEIARETRQALAARAGA
ncbi:MAG: acetate kinase [Desulfobacterales bacterium]